MKKTNDKDIGFSCGLLFVAICLLLPISAVLIFVMPPAGVVLFGVVVYTLGAAIEGFAMAMGIQLEQRTTWILAVVILVVLVCVMWIVMLLTS